MGYARGFEIARPQLVARPESGTIFHEPWWLNAACPGGYGEAAVEAGGKIIARMPYASSTRYGRTVLGLPALSHVLGPTTTLDDRGVSIRRASREIGVIKTLISQLPRFSHANFRLHGRIDNTLGFEMEGFRTTVSFTVEIPPKPTDMLWQDLRDKTRNAIRRAHDSLEVIEIADHVLFLDFYEENLRQRGVLNSYDRATAGALIQAALERGAGRLLAAVDGAGVYRAAIFPVWDWRSEYYFMSTRTDDAPNGAVSMLIWESIKHAAENNLIFDMDGIQVVGARSPNFLLLTGFGGSIKPRYIVKRSDPDIQIALELRHWFRTGRSRSVLAAPI
jgi:hypothetical protein